MRKRRINTLKKLDKISTFEAFQAWHDCGCPVMPEGTTVLDWYKELQRLWID